MTEFFKITVDVYGDELGAYRVCYLCETMLYESEYIKTNLPLFMDANPELSKEETIKGLLNVWNNEILAIPCCHCYKYITGIDKVYGGHTIISDSITYKRLNNLKKNAKVYNIELPK